MHTAPYQAHSATSKAAAGSIQSQLGRLQAEIYRLVQSAGENGLTADEIEQRGIKGSTVRPRLLELQTKNLVTKTARTRNTTSGRQASVYVVSNLQRTVEMKSWEGLQHAKYYLVQTMDQFRQFMDQMVEQTTVAVDTETSGFDIVRDRPCGLVFGWGIENNYYLPIAMQTMEPQLNIQDIQEEIAEYLAREDVTKIFWNAKFDQHFLRKAGIEVANPLHDGVVLMHLLDENREKGLKDVSLEKIGKTADCWEKALHRWRTQESLRRRKSFSDLLKGKLSDERPELQAEFNREYPFLQFSGLTKAQQTAKLKAYLKTKLKDHAYARNKKEDITYDQVPLDIMTPYACADVHYTFMVYKDLLPKVAGHDSLRKLYINEMRLSALLFEVESRGVKIDVPHLRALRAPFLEEVDKLEKEIHDEVGHEFNIGSTQQLAAALRDQGVRLTKMTKAGKNVMKEVRTLRENGKNEEATELQKKVTYSVDSDTLEHLATQHKFAGKVMGYREKKKMLSTYVDNIIELVDDDRYLHSTFNANVSTGRMSSREPNVQNIPGRLLDIRRAFTLPEPVGMEGCGNDEYVYIFMDYSQVELRLTAHWSQDPTLLAAYPRVGEDQDVHSITCAEAVMGKPVDYVLDVLDKGKAHPEYAEVKWFRNIAKRVNFGIIYGAEAPTIQRQVSTPDRHVTKEECQIYIDKYFAKYGGVNNWIKYTTTMVKMTGYLQNTFGRYRRLPDAKSSEKWKQQRAGRQGVNFLIQGDAADVFKHAAVRVREVLREHNAKTKIVNFIHDEIQFYWHRDEFHLLKPVKEAMEDFPQFTVPIKVDIEFSKRDWAAKQDLKAAV